jgi:hypothetical protein
MAHVLSRSVAGYRLGSVHIGPCARTRASLPCRAGWSVHPRSRPGLPQATALPARGVRPRRALTDRTSGVPSRDRAIGPESAVPLRVNRQGPTHIKRPSTQCRGPFYVRVASPQRLEHVSSTYTNRLGDPPMRRGSVAPPTHSSGRARNQTTPSPGSVAVPARRGRVARRGRPARATAARRAGKDQHDKHSGDHDTDPPNQLLTWIHRFTSTCHLSLLEDGYVGVHGDGFVGRRVARHGATLLAIMNP